MFGRQRPDEEREQRLRDAFWNAGDAAAPQLPDTFEARSAYERARLSAQVLHVIRERMNEEHISQQELARRLGVSEGRVSQILSGDQNLTFKTLGALAAALKVRLRVSLEPIEAAHTQRVAVTN